MRQTAATTGVSRKTGHIHEPRDEATPPGSPTCDTWRQQHAKSQRMIVSVRQDECSSIEIGMTYMAVEKRNKMKCSAS